MAASSPSLSNSIAEPSAAVSSPSNISASKNLRGLNKPKCIKCGNVARSRCPFQSCKSCCVKALNPCHIHVPKGQSNRPDKAPSFASPTVDQQQPTDASHPGRPSSLRQLSSNFAQFINLPTPPKSRKPITRKDAQVINQWRFLKLKEFKDNTIEVENEAFDRYMQNVSLLEEVFGVGSSQEASSSENPKPTMVARFKLQLRSNPSTIENTRKRMKFVVEKGLQKLEPQNPETDSNKSLGLADLIERLNKARNEEDLKACWAMKTSLFNESQTMVSPLKEIAGYSPPKWFSTSTIDQEELCEISAQFDSLEGVEVL